MTFRRLFLAAALVAVCLTAALPAAAQTGSGVSSSDIHLEIPLPSPVENGVSGAASSAVRGLADYISRVYVFMIGIVGMVAAIMMIVGGFQYITSAGNTGKMSAAKKRIADAFIGLVLALGSYVILNTLNPQLVNLKPLTTSEVHRTTTILAWCEDLIAQHINVTPLGKAECGFIGTYAKSGKSVSPCMYAGSCGAQSSSKLSNFATCMQIAGIPTLVGTDGKPVQLTPDVELSMAQKDPTYAFGVCRDCATITTNFLSRFGYDTLSQACATWQENMNAQLRRQPNDDKRSWASCQPMPGQNSCAQVDIDCQAAEDNSDNSSNSQCTDGTHDCGCEGYDDAPAIRYTQSYTLDGHGEAQNYNLSSKANLDDEPGLLGSVCRANPCRDYAKPNTQNRDFSKGCEMKGASDCRNVNRAVLPSTPENPGGIPTVI